MNIIYIQSDLIIEINKKIIKTWNQRHPEQPESIDVGKDRLDEVLSIVRNVGNDLDRHDSLTVKAAHLIGGLAWAQAFSGANKRTAVLTGSLFLSKNGLRLQIPQEQYHELRKLLFDIQEEREQLNSEIIDKIVLYIRRNTIRP